MDANDNCILSPVFVYSGTENFGDRNDTYMVDYSKRLLLQENFIPSFNLQSRRSYLQTGGNCERIQTFEDYDYWLRLAGTR